MRPAIREQTKDAVTNDILVGMVAWRQQHPKATLREIEAELDQRWAQVRARMVEDLARASAATQRRFTHPVHAWRSTGDVGTTLWCLPGL